MAFISANKIGGGRGSTGTKGFKIDAKTNKIESKDTALKNKALSIVKKASGNITKDTLVKNLRTAGSKTGPGKIILGTLVLSEAAEWAMNKFKNSKKLSDKEYKMGTDLTGAPSIRDKAKAQGKKLPRKLKVGKKMGGGKVYVSMDKKYGGGIFPKKGNM